MTSTPLPLIVLGSASPRRRDLLRQLALPFEQVVSPEDEPVPDNHRPETFVRISASTKARAVRRLVEDREPAIVIGADTVVVLDDHILGKPADEVGAAAMLEALSGRTHRVFTGLSVIRPGGEELQDHAVTRVRVRPFSTADIAWYVATGEPLDKAGAYGIQGLGARFIECIEGCYYNVVGLPLARLSTLLERAGYPFANPSTGQSTANE